MNARIVSTILAATLFTSVPASADAAMFHAVYKGTITDGSDADNLFGLSGQNIVDMGLTADITYLTSIPGTRTLGDMSDEVFSTDFANSVISSVVLTIGSKSFSFNPTYYADVYTSRGFLDVYALDLNGTNLQTYFFPDQDGPTNLETAFSGTGSGDTGGGATQYSAFLSGSDIIDFNTTSVSVAAVPEPAAWGMMILGFAVLGGMMRYRRRKTTVRMPALA